MPLLVDFAFGVILVALGRLVDLASGMVPAVLEHRVATLVGLAWDSPYGNDLDFHS